MPGVRGGYQLAPDEWRSLITRPPKSRFSRPSLTACQGVSVRSYFAFFSSQSMLTDLGRVMAVPTARFHTNWDSMPMARETLKSTV